MKISSDKFIPGKSYIPASGKVFNEKEVSNAIEAARDGWWTEGRLRSLRECYSFSFDYSILNRN